MSASQSQSALTREYCPTCGAETRDGARFCYQCGAALHPDTESPAEAIIPTVFPPAPPAMPFAPPMGTVPPMPPLMPPPYAYAPPIARAPQRSGMAVAGFCLGVATVVIGIVLTWLGTIMGVCGLIFSLIGMSETSVRSRLAGGPRTGRGFAIAGAVLSVIGIIGSVVLLVYILQNAARFGIQLPRAGG